MPQPMPDESFVFTRQFSLPGFFQPKQHLTHLRHLVGKLVEYSTVDYDLPWFR